MNLPGNESFRKDGKKDYRDNDDDEGCNQEFGPDRGVEKPPDYCILCLIRHLLCNLLINPFPFTYLDKGISEPQWRHLALAKHNKTPWFQGIIKFFKYLFLKFLFKIYKEVTAEDDIHTGELYIRNYIEHPEGSKISYLRYYL